MKSLKLFFLAVACLLTMAATAQNQPQSKGQMNAQKLATTLYLIENFYVDTANMDKVTDDAIAAALKELDPHSAYISKKDVEKANEPLIGSFEGIGVTFQLIRDTLTVISPTAGGPSEKVGIMAGDQFIKIRDRYLSVSVQEFLSQTRLPASPFLLSLHILKIDMLFMVISCKYIVKTQGCVLEIGGEGLGR